ncbi:MAG: pantoate--beta-alanine ligase [Candidatus Zixiibacteriota bacterium]|nr:MAG: pantoate--beta-alanine ligase [candidate division Zixibacteria bacterium]
MKIVRSIRRMQILCREIASKGRKIGLVPTMGFLHEGHLSLIGRAGRLSDFVITSIFVNPTQFSADEDLAGYPRDEKKDIRDIETAGGHIVFIPKTSAIYPEDYQTFVTVEKITESLEGAFRPTHFRGVTTIVTKLFNITRPDVAVFGMKDYQQAMVIKKMIRDLDYPVRLVIAPTVREKDGLAMSSRNSYFTPAQRKEAVCLYRALETARTMVIKDGVGNVAVLQRKMKNVIKSICPTAEIDYIAFTEFETLRPVQKVSRKHVCSLAVRVHGVRLIDNMKML